MRRTGNPPTARYTTMALLIHFHQSMRLGGSWRRRTVRSHGRIIDHGNNIRVCVIVDSTIIVAQNGGRMYDQTEHVATSRPHGESPYCSASLSAKRYKRGWVIPCKKQMRSHEHQRTGCPTGIVAPGRHVLSDIMLGHIKRPMGSACTTVPK
jgi:hypothetical protein